MSDVVKGRVSLGVLSTERGRVALVPTDAKALIADGFELKVEHGIGAGLGWPDQTYQELGAQCVTREEVLRAEVVVGGDLPSDPQLAWAPGTQVVGLFDPLRDASRVEHLRRSGVSAFSLELVPRTTRAQSMDVLSSMAALAGYRSVLIAAERLDRVLPMMSTAAGTLPPARVLVIGAGVAGLQAIATARRLGARVSAFDIRPEAREQVISVGGEFIEADLEAAEGASTSDANGYALEQSDERQARIRSSLAGQVALADIVICTALVQGRKAPVIIDAGMVDGMRPGSVVVDVAASHGGNCELTMPGQEVAHRGVAVVGVLDAADQVAADASRLYSRNLANFVRHLVPDGSMRTVDQIDSDPILSATLVVTRGAVVRDGLAAPVTPATAPLVHTGDSR